MKRPSKRLNYTKLRRQIDTSARDQWENILKAAIEEPTNEDEELEYCGVGCSVSEVEIEDTSIHAVVCFSGIGEAMPDDDGDYQDENGAYIDYDEIEASYVLTVTNTETKWEDN